MIASGGVLESQSQSQQPRNPQQVYRRKPNVPSATKENYKDDLLSLIRLQEQNPSFDRAASCVSKSYYVFSSHKCQLQDAEKFCCQENDVLSLGIIG